MISSAHSLFNFRLQRSPIDVPRQRSQCFNRQSLQSKDKVRATQSQCTADMKREFRSRIIVRKTGCSSSENQPSATHQFAPLLPVTAPLHFVGAMLVAVILHGDLIFRPCKVKRHCRTGGKHDIAHNIIQLRPRNAMSKQGDSLLGFLRRRRTRHNQRQCSDARRAAGESGHRLHESHQFAIDLSGITLATSAHDVDYGIAEHDQRSQRYMDCHLCPHMEHIERIHPRIEFHYVRLWHELPHMRT